MNIIQRHIEPQFLNVMRQLTEDPDRTFPELDITTLIALVMYFVIICDGEKANIVANVCQRCSFDRKQVEFILDMFRGDNPRFYLWSRGPSSKYKLIFV